MSLTSFKTPRLEHVVRASMVQKQCKPRQNRHAKNLKWSFPFLIKLLGRTLPQVSSCMLCFAGLSFQFRKKQRKPLPRNSPVALLMSSCFNALYTSLQAELTDHDQAQVMIRTWFGLASSSRSRSAGCRIASLRQYTFEDQKHEIINSDRP